MLAQLMLAGTSTQCVVRHLVLRDPEGKHKLVLANISEQSMDRRLDQRTWGKHNLCGGLRYGTTCVLRHLVPTQPMLA